MKKNALLILTILFSFQIVQSQGILDQLKEHISGGQLSYYTKTSYSINRTSSASSITYVNFCPDGSYIINSEGSFYSTSTENSGDDSGYRVDGGHNNTSSGRWDIKEQNSIYYLLMTTTNGQTSTYPIDISKLIQGKWEDGRTTYVFAPNYAECN